MSVGNAAIAAYFDETADLLESQGASPFRVGAYRRGAQRLLGLTESAAELLEREGRAGLVSLPDIGRGLAAAIDEIVHTGHYSALERLRGRLGAEDVFVTVPGIGERLAARIHDTLHIDTLEELEAAASDGRLAEVSGIGPRRAAAILACLARRLDRSPRYRALARPRQGRADDAHPPIELLLAIDEEYRRRAEADELPRVAPQRFNPEGRAWLPIWHTHRGGWAFTVMFSNTGLAHRLGRTGDWVVIISERDGNEDQATVVTEYRGPLMGKRVVRGRDDECLEHYQSQDVEPEVRATIHAIGERLASP